MVFIYCYIYFYSNKIFVVYYRALDLWVFADSHMILSVGPLILTLSAFKWLFDRGTGVDRKEWASCMCEPEVEGYL
jgi:hypothetical protein